MRVIGTKHSLPEDTRDEFNSESAASPLQVFRMFRDRWLVQGEEESSFDYVHSLLNYGFEIAKNMSPEAHIRFSEDRGKLFYNGRELNLAEWKKFPGDCIRAAERRLSESDPRMPPQDRCAPPVR